MRVKRAIAGMLAMGMLALATPALAEAVPTDVAQAAEAPVAAVGAGMADSQKLDANYTLALNAIGTEDYEAAKEYLMSALRTAIPRPTPRDTLTCC